jgi:hypothetical protein
MLSGVDVEHSQNQAKLRCVILADRGHITVGAEKFCKCLKVSLESLHRRELDLHPIRQKVIPRFSPLRGHERSLAIATTGPVKRCVGSGEGRPFEKLGFKPPPNALLGHSGRHFRSCLRNPATTPAPSRAQLIS